MNPLLLKLEGEIKFFKEWADDIAVKYGEWETDYHHWDKIYRAIDEVLKHVPTDEWNVDVYELILYALARDNECENVIQTLIEYPNVLKCLAYKALTHDDYDARWQIAYGLGEIEDTSNEVQDLITRFLEDDNEYVRRRALHALEKRNKEKG